MRTITLKPFEPKELVARVSSSIQRYERNGFDVMEVVFPNRHQQIDLCRQTERQRNRSSAKELELLYFLASNPNKVFTREQLLEKCGDMTFMATAEQWMCISKA